MIRSTQYNQYSLTHKIRIAIKTLPAEKAFFFGVSICVFLLMCLFLAMYQLRSMTIDVPVYNTKLTIGVTDTPKYFIPLYTAVDSSKVISSLLFSGLLHKNIDGNYVNDLAENVIKSNDGMVIEVTLKTGIKFSNNTPITVDDVIYTYELLTNPDVNAIDRVKYEGLSFEKVDDTHFTLTMKKPYANINDILSVGILAKSEFDKENLSNLTLSEKSQQTIYSGAYEIDSIQKNGNNISSVSLSSNPNYYNRPYIKYVDFIMYASSKDAINAYNNGDIDMGIGFSTEDTQQISEKENTDTIAYALPRVTALYLNSSAKELFIKKENRQKLYTAINRNDISNALLSGNVLPVYGLMPSSVYSGATNTPELSADSFSATATLSILNTPSQLAIAQYIQNSYRNIGLIVEIKTFDQTALLQVIKNRDFQMLLYTVEIETPTDLYAFWHSSQRNAPGLNITSYNSKTFDSNLEKIKTASSTDATTLLLSDLETEFYIEYPYIPLYTQRKFAIFHKNAHIKMPLSISSTKDLFSDIQNWYTQTEKVLPITQIGPKREQTIKNIYNTLY